MKNTFIMTLKRSLLQRSLLVCTLLASTLIRSTISGIILDIPVKVGNSVILANTFNDGTTIATVADMNDLIFRGNIDETEVGRLFQGMPMKITVGALQGVNFEATLEYISPKAVEVEVDGHASLTGLFPENAVVAQKVGAVGVAELVARDAGEGVGLADVGEIVGDEGVVESGCPECPRPPRPWE